MFNGKSKKFELIALLSLSLVWVEFSSCLSHKKLAYSKGLPSSTSTSTQSLVQSLPTVVDPVILANDVLAITVQTKEQKSVNLPVTANAQVGFNPLNTFVVDKNGNVDLALIGVVKVAGLTTSEARKVLDQRAREYFTDPVVSVYKGHL